MVRRLSSHYLVTISHLDVGFEPTEGSAVLTSCHSQKKNSVLLLGERKKERKRCGREES